ncbi:hypothetical protein [Streptomyces sp. NBC_00035]|uniref:hypothetical protein n=1 Tax=Streptomyces sp. NBC_00035 TaxID=2903614 RepID=UPI0032548058
MAETDRLLEQLIKRVNKTGTPIDVTVTVNGAVVTGKLVPRSQWLEANIEQLNGAESEYAPFVDDFALEGGIVDHEEYLHLHPARLVHSLEIIPRKGAAFRTRTSDVQAWMLGRLQRDDDGPEA